MARGVGRTFVYVRVCELDNGIDYLTTKGFRMVSGNKQQVIKSPLYSNAGKSVTAFDAVYWRRRH